VGNVALWPCFAGAIFFLAGLIAVRKEFVAAQGWDKLVALGSIFVAAPLAGFGAEHLAFARSIMQGVPAWMPARLFVAYFVGVALIAAALALTFKTQVRLTGTLLAIMFLGFVVLLHAPNVVTHLHERVYWTVALRDLVFAAGSLALTGTRQNDEGGPEIGVFIAVARMCVAIALLFFGVEEFLFPRFVPGVPLMKAMPDWVPVPTVLSYLCGAILFVAGLCLLLNKNARMAVAAVGLMTTVLTFGLYLPILLTVRTGGQIVEGFNYVADTMLFGGVILFLAAGLTRRDRTAVA